MNFHTMSELLENIRRNKRSCNILLIEAGIQRIFYDQSIQNGGCEISSVHDDFISITKSVSGKKE